MRILFFGDSITQGFWDTQGGWVQRIRRHYDSQIIPVLDTTADEIIPEFFNLGISGDTTRGLLARVEQETSTRAAAQGPIIVVVAIGTNDDVFEHDRRWVPPEEFRDNLTKIVEKLQPLAANIVLVGNPACDETKTTPVSWGEYYYTNTELRRSEGTIKAVAEQFGLPFVPLFDRFSAARNSGQELLADGLHPNDAGHELIASLVLPELQTCIDNLKD